MNKALVSTVFFALATIGLGVPASASGAPARIASTGDSCNGTTDCFGIDVTFSNRSITVIETVFDYGDAGSTTVLRKVHAVNVPYRTMVLGVRRPPRIPERRLSAVKLAEAGDQAAGLAPTAAGLGSRGRAERVCAKPCGSW